MLAMASSASTGAVDDMDFFEEWAEEESKRPRLTQAGQTDTVVSL